MAKVRVTLEVEHPDDVQLDWEGLGQDYGIHIRVLSVKEED
jgi:hypothetical protein